jgi:hypothetical protein
MFPPYPLRPEFRCVLELCVQVEPRTTSPAMYDLAIRPDGYMLVRPDADDAPWRTLECADTGAEYKHTELLEDVMIFLEAIEADEQVHQYLADVLRVAEIEGFDFMHPIRC